MPSSAGPAGPVGPTSPPASLDRGGFLTPPAGALPGDRCVRCGAATPAGVALCAEHNPAGIRGPSATQMHATILGGVLLGAIFFLLLMRLAAGSGEPFRVELLGAGADAEGDIAVAFSIVNESGSERVADCRVTRDGVPRPDDLAFRTERLPAGQLVLVERDLPPAPAASVPYALDRLTVVCT
jgi:hypothetical protein